MKDGYDDDDNYHDIKDTDYKLGIQCLGWIRKSYDIRLNSVVHTYAISIMLL